MNAVMKVATYHSYILFGNDDDLQIILIGQLMFLLILKKQRVTREITMATIALAMGKEPTRASISDALEKKSSNIYLEDYKQFRPKHFSLMTLLMDGGIEAAREALELINSNMTEDCLKFGRLRTDLGEIKFQADVRNVIVDIIYNTLFIRCLGMSKSLTSVVKFHHGSFF